MKSDLGDETTNIEKTHSAEYTTDQQFHAYVVSRLGREAADKALTEALQIGDFARRAQFLAQAATWLSLFDDRGGYRQEPEAERDNVTSLPIEEPPHLVAEEAVVEEVHEVSGIHDETEAVVQEMQPEEVIHQKAPVAHETESDEYKVDSRIHYAFEKLCGKDMVDQLKLGPDSGAAVASFLIDLRGVVGLRSNSPDMRTHITMMHEGKTTQQIREATGVLSDMSLHQRWSMFMKKVQANVAKNDIDVVALLKTYLEPNDSQEAAAEGAADIQGEGALPEPEVIEKVESEPQERTDDSHDTDRQFDELLDELCVTNPEYAHSVRALVTDEKYNPEEMTIGRSLLGELVGQYANNRADARKNLGQLDEAAYRALCDLANSGVRGATGNNRSARTLLSITRFSQASEAQVLEHITRLFQAAINDGYEVEPVLLQPSPASMPKVVTPLHAVYEKLTVEPQPISVDLFAVAKGEQKVTKGDWNNAVDEFFLDLSKRQVLTGAEAQLLKHRILNHETELDDVTRRVLNMLQKQSSKPESQIDDTAVRDAFNRFTMTAFGANSIEYIAERLSKSYKKDVHVHTVERRVIGGIAAVLGRGNV